MKNDEKGITLILLVIIVIVLLILTGVTIVTISNNGIVDHSLSVAEKTKIENKKEEIELAIVTKINESSDDITINDIIDILEKKKIIDEWEQETGQVKTEEGYVYEITEDEDWKVKYIGKEEK